MERIPEGNSGSGGVILSSAPLILSENKPARLRASPGRPKSGGGSLAAFPDVLIALCRSRTAIAKNPAEKLS